MPLENLPNSGNSNADDSQASRVVYDEPISYHTKYILGAKLKQADFEFVDVADTVRFDELSDGVFFTDISEDSYGTIRQRVGRKIDGNRQYLIDNIDGEELRFFVTDEVNNLKPIIINPETDDQFPLASEALPLYQGRTFVFVGAGTFLGEEVEVGSTATIISDIADNTRPTWDNVAYNGSGQTVEFTPITFLDSIRLDGSAVTDRGVSERAVATAITNLQAQFNNGIAVVDEKFTNLFNGLQAQVTDILAAIGALTNRLDSQPVSAVETINIGDGVARNFLVGLTNKFLYTPVMFFKMRDAGGSLMPISQLNAHTYQDSNGDQFLAVNFAGVPTVNQFQVELQGLVAPV